MTSAQRTLSAGWLALAALSLLPATTSHAQSGLRFKPEVVAPSAPPGGASYLSGYGGGSVLSSSGSENSSATLSQTAPLPGVNDSAASLGTAGDSAVAPVDSEARPSDPNNVTIPYTPPRSPGGGLKIK